MVSVGQCRAEAVVCLAAGKASCRKVATGDGQDGHDFFGLCKVHVMSPEMLCMCNMINVSFMAEDGTCGGSSQREQPPHSNLRAEMAKNAIVSHGLCGTELSRLKSHDVHGLDACVN